MIVIAAGVFIYYLDSLRAEKSAGSKNRLFALLALAAVGFGVVVGFTNIGSPATQRLVSQDRRRLFDLSSVAQALHLKSSVHGQSEFVLPKTIQDVETLVNDPAAKIVDPVSEQVYQYTPLGETTYRLCATFAMPSPADVPAQWRHSAGTACFNLDARENVAFVPIQF